MTVALSSKVEISPDVLCQEVSGEMVLLDLKSEAYFGLDTTGARIWQLLQSQSHLGTVLDTMLDEFEVERDQLAEDLKKLVDGLLDAGLVSIGPAD